MSIVSLNDQLVPIYSSLFTVASHLGALNIDSEAYQCAPTLTISLLGLAKMPLTTMLVCKNGTNGQDSSSLIVFIRCCHIGGDD